MVKKEFTNNREADRQYMNWHRTFPDQCYAFDLDCVEVRGNQIVAIVELKGLISPPMSDWAKRMYLQIADALGVPAYCVFHNVDLTNDEANYKFRVENLHNGEISELNNEEYRMFIEFL